MKFQIKDKEENRSATVHARSDAPGLGQGWVQYQINLGGITRTVRARREDQGTLLIEWGEQIVKVPFVRGQGGQYELGHDLITAHVVAQDSRAAHYSLAGSEISDNHVAVNMPGKIVSVMVSEGDSVTQGQGVVIVEAMKMENELKAGRDGTVAKILVAEGDTVDSGAVLIEIED